MCVCVRSVFTIALCFTFRFRMKKFMFLIFVMVFPDYVYPYGPPPPPPDQPLPLLGNMKAAADAIDAAIYTANSGYYSSPWPTPLTAWVY